MIDPFSTLTDSGDNQSTPRAAFAEALRRRIERALGIESTVATTRPGVADDAGHLFYATLPAADADRAADFYRELFDWDLREGAGGYHIEGVYPPMGLAASESPTPQIWIEVSDIELAVERVRELGGHAEEAVQYESGWNAACRDDQGVEFNIIVPVAHYRQGQARSTEVGELFYWSLPAPDAARSKAFYRDLFGWEFGDPGDAGGLHVANKLPDGGLGGGRAGTAADLFFRVADLDAAMAKVRSLGGRAEPAGQGPEGRHARCADDQGTPFGLSEPAAE